MVKPLARRAILLGGTAVLAAPLARVAAAPAAPTPRRITQPLAAGRSPFAIGCDERGVTSLRFRGDTFDTDYVRAGARLGRVRARVRTPGSAADGWTMIDSDEGRVQRTAAAIAARVEAAGAALSSTMTLDGETLRWDIALTATGDHPVEVGDLILPLPIHTQFEGGRPATEAVLKHSFVSGHGSHVFWMRSNSAGPFLLLLPERDTSLEYWDVQRADGRETWCAYLHAGVAAAETRSRGTNWRLPTSSVTLAPGQTHRYAFRFVWADGYAAVRAAIAAAGLVDVEIVPGMTVPSDLHADISLASRDRIVDLTAEHPEQTTLTRLPDRAGRQLWRVRFARLGENRLTIHQAHGRRTELEFFATEPVETMMMKRGAFITRRQHRDSAKWYDGLFGEWNMASGTLLGPDNYDRIGGWRVYEVTCDDPGLSKPAFLASKNAEHPVAAEVAALDRYIDRFVWGGLQMTTAERYPYGIYGILDWKQNRESADPGSKGRRHIWRPYDYPHIFAMYHAMHRVARDHREVPTRHGARDYLERAAGTAIAMFTVPAAAVGWEAYSTGFYNECVIPALVADLRRAGMSAQADTLEGHWARKVRSFVSGQVDLFGSEYAFDSTGFESTQALARSALDRPAAMGVTRDAAEGFAKRQMAANLFCRGWIEPAYYYLGSDYRGTAGDAYTLTYMAQMGGGAVLDHALNDVAGPHPLLRLGYASQLSAWALLNSGTAQSGYGYWYPGEANDGGAGGGFEPAAEGMTWLDQPHHRGSWYYSCEIDLGFTGAVRAARTIVADDPLFGRIAYGGALSQAGGEIRVIPRDGVRRRLSVRLDLLGLDLELSDARFAPDAPIVLSAGSGALVFQPEVFAPGQAAVTVRYRHVGGDWQTAALPVGADGCRLAV